MADDLTERLRGLFGGEAVEKKMFGGVAFMVDGHMAVAASGRGVLMVRVDPGRLAELATEDGVAPMVMNGHQLKGWLDVQADRLQDDVDLERWVGLARELVATLPPT